MHETPPAESTNTARGPRALLAFALLVTLVLAVVPRAVRGDRHYWPQIGYVPAGAESSRFFSMKPDGLYHTRRVQRAFAEGLPVAETDPYLNYPDGAAIPWPPYYDTLLWATAAPFAPEEGIARRRFVEEWVATFPMVCGVLTSLVAALAGWLLAGGLGALAAGAYHALTFGSINYTTIGNGDHHGFVALLMSLLLLGLSLAFRGGLTSPRRGLAWGVGLGAIVGLLLGSWVASLVYVVFADLALAWLLFARARRPLPGLPALGLALHATAALTILPAVLSSPWRRDSPWMTINLSWFHPLYLVLGGLVFVPLVAAGETRFRAGTSAARRYPWVVGGALLALAAILGLLDAGPARGIREAVEWASRVNPFMDVVEESRPLLGPKAGGTLVRALGAGAFLAPFAWALAAFHCFRRGRLELLPWVVSFPPMAIQALQQRRFADALAVPLAVLLGWALAQRVRWKRAVWIPALAGGLAVWLLAPGGTRIAPTPLAIAAGLGLAAVRASRWPARAWAPFVIAAALLCHHGSLWRRVRNGFDPPREFWGGELFDSLLGERLMLEWIRENSTPGDWSVLSQWDDGHQIEWAADRPTVATNFGSYVGAESFDDPPAFFLAASEAAALEILERRRVRYVLVTDEIVAALPMMIRVHAPERRGYFLSPSNQLLPGFFESMAGRLLPRPLAGGVGEPMLVRAPALQRLRLAYASPIFRRKTFDPHVPELPLRAGWVWERVAGATIEAEGAPGQELAVSFRVQYPGSAVTLDVRASARVDAAGRARLRLPYCTDAANGDGVADGPARWSLGDRSGEIAIPEAAVQGGGTVRIP